MECDTQSKTLTVHQAVELRRQAADLLNRLLADREQSERRFAEAGKRDPMKFITGRTAFDVAISTAEELIANMDNLLLRLNGDQGWDLTEAAPQIHTIRLQPKTSARNGKTSSNGRAVHGVHTPVSATMTP